MTDPLDRLARAWDDVAEGYDHYFVPRFAPWADAAVDALDAALPPGTIAVACCGTGPELARVAGRWPERPLLGVDLSAEMVRMARGRMESMGAAARLVVGDATCAESWGPCAAIVSVFGLQQMPDPRGAVASWTSALTGGGVLSLIYWPEGSDPGGPFSWLRQAFADEATRADFSWEADLAATIRTNDAIIVRDELLAFEMAHDSAAAFFDAMVDCGPARPRAVSLGPERAAAARRAFLEVARGGPLRHRPRARHLVAHRR
jgi:SAM-dependent methyltransferase